MSDGNADRRPAGWIFNHPWRRHFFENIFGCFRQPFFQKNLKTGRDFQPRALKSLPGQNFIHSQSRSYYSRTGVRNAERFKQSLNFAILSIPPVQGVENNVNLPENLVMMSGFAAQMPTSFFAYKNVFGRIFYRQIAQNTFASFERNFLFKGRPSAQHADSDGIHVLIITKLKIKNTKPAEAGFVGYVLECPSKQ